MSPKSWTRNRVFGAATADLRAIALDDAETACLQLVAERERLDSTRDLRRDRPVMAVAGVRGYRLGFPPSVWLSHRRVAGISGVRREPSATCYGISAGGAVALAANQARSPGSRLSMRPATSHATPREPTVTCGSTRLDQTLAASRAWGRNVRRTVATRSRRSTSRNRRAIVSFRL
jgi:hypothetical protein